MLRLILERSDYREEERREIRDYNRQDVIEVAKLLNVLAPEIDLPRALLRGRYMAAVARSNGRVCRSINTISGCSWHTGNLSSCITSGATTSSACMTAHRFASSGCLNSLPRAAGTGR